MAKYAQLSDITDTSISVIEGDLLEADVYIDTLLQRTGVSIDPNNIPELLNKLAVYFACYRACIRLAQLEDTIYIDKAKLYEKLYKELEAQVSAETLGLSTSVIVTAEVSRA